MKNNKILLLTASAILVIFAIASYTFKKEPQVSVTRLPPEQLVKFHSPSLGNPNAKVTIVEFLDPECESCAAFYPTVKGLLSEYPDKVRFVVRYMLYHSNSKLAALATEAAGKQGKYWEMQAQLFHQTDWTHQEAPQNKKFEEIAKGMNLDVAKFQEDMKDPGTIANVEADFKEGPTLGVSGTPTIFVNGRKLEELSYSRLKGLIEDELKAN